ncbi:putative pentatricopeptide repeat-containing protein At3g25970 [Magnolia sinica]|uniref:putative pentatricopeptide repeat-containing protein At3g25970 n=1 Tax=Magnolia sinica TaxID=86752 RepID=UPI00265ABB41|nr:putative pentatricopeptide repeat-containing protein At3g25970 [Magnolia sinica]XP_058113990.1 putative pentatricopeptide repeat-containing protein At3g25970 [Magnolia sinica]XP_058113991.1 putative pentatricopeptide repeat-containing protein At3g25970 [Magnolia sinica]
MFCRETLKSPFQRLSRRNRYGHCSRHTTCPFLIPRNIQTTPSNTPARTHAHVIKTGMIADTYTANTILATYSKCGVLIDARNLFEEIPQRDTVSWNSMIAGYVNGGDYEAAWLLLRAMRMGGFGLDQYTFGSTLKAIASVNCVGFGRQIHTVVIKMGFEQNVFSGSALVDMYAKCRRIEDASAVFERMPDRNSVSWNAMIAGCGLADDCANAFLLLNRMERIGMWPDEATFASVLTLLDGPKFYKLTSQLHAKIIKNGRASDTIACNATITAYSECGSIDDAVEAFDDMEATRDLVSWNSMLAAYAWHDRGANAIELFVKMKELGIDQDMYTYTSAISACFEQEQQNQGKSLHGLVIKAGFEHTITVANSLIAMYLKSDDKSMEDAIKCFDSMDSRDNVSCNSILTGFSQNGLSEEALRFFGRMRSSHQEIDHYAFSAVLRSCSDLAVLQLGRQVHALVLKLGFESNDFVASSLIFMYSKCGVLEDSRRSFDETQQDSSITWNSIIFGYAQHGLGKTSLDLFSQMQQSKLKPDHITFVGILSACSHVGLVEEGLNFLRSMEPVHGIPLRMEHYACGVDIFGRAGRLDEAKALIESMPFKPDAMVWKTLLGACRNHGNIEMAIEIARLLLVLEPEEHSTYVLLSNMYAGFGRWGERAMIKRVMRDRGLRKVPGWSWIEVKNKVHTFNAEDRSHPQVEEIYEMLGELMEEIGRSDYVAIVDFSTHDADYEGIDCRL